MVKHLKSYFVTVIRFGVLKRIILCHWAPAGYCQSGPTTCNLLGQLNSWRSWARLSDESPPASRLPVDVRGSGIYYYKIKQRKLLTFGHSTSILDQGKMYDNYSNWHGLCFRSFQIFLYILMAVPQNSDVSRVNRVTWDNQLIILKYITFPKAVRYNIIYDCTSKFKKISKTLNSFKS